MWSDWSCTATLHHSSHACLVVDAHGSSLDWASASDPADIIGMRNEALNERITITERIGELADIHPDSTAVVCIGPRGDAEELTWRDLDRRSNAAARALLAHTDGRATMFGVALPAGIPHVIAAIAGWKAGCLVVPLNPGLGATEASAVRDAFGDNPIVGGGSIESISEAVLFGGTDDRLLAPTGPLRSATMTGGSTGKSRIVIREREWSYERGAYLSPTDAMNGMDYGLTQLVTLPLYHAGFTALHQGLALDHTIILMKRFSPKLFGETIEKYRVQYLRIVPLYMSLALEDPTIDSRDLSSVQGVNHGSGPCPDHVKRRWLELFGPRTIIEDYSCVERIGVVWIRGDEWLEHPGSVGRPTECDVRILGEENEVLPPNEIGRIFVRSHSARQPAYIGNGPTIEEVDGYFSVGDLGYVDEDGYLFLIDRKINVINSGGADIYPLEIEQVLLTHPAVLDVAVVRAPHPHLTWVPHAVVVPRSIDDPPSTADLEQHCRNALSMNKVPLSYEIRERLGRDASGKLRRIDLEQTVRAAAVPAVAQ